MKNLLLSFCIFFSGSVVFCQSESRVNITSFSSSVNTNQDYSPWLNDNMSDLVTNVWQSINMQYVDVTLPLATITKVSRVSLYDYQGIFTDAPAYIYAQYGSQKTLLGIFTGETYQNWVDMIPSSSVLAESIVVHKFGNNIPVKIKVFGLPPQTQATINFPELPSKMIGDLPFGLNATSNNLSTPITYTSSNPSIVSVSNTTGGWKATIVGAGVASIKASQAASTGFSAANDIIKLQIVTAAPYQALPGKIEAESYSVMSGIQTETTSDIGGGQNVGYVDEGDWMDYRVNVATTGTYALNLRFASPVNTGVIEVRNTSGSVLNSVNLSNTGGWQTYTTITSSINLSAGQQILRLYAKKAGWNLNWFEVATQTQAVINFSALADKTVSDQPFVLNATSTNTATPITFTSSNPAVASVSNTTGVWKATLIAVGTASITASQTAGNGYLAATNVVQQQRVLPVGSTVTTTGKIPLDGKRWYQLVNASSTLEKLNDGQIDEAPHPGYGLILTNFDAYYPLHDGESMTIDSIKMFDGLGNNINSPMTLSIITNTWQRIQIASFTGEKYMEWVGPYPNRTSGPNKFKLDVSVSNVRYLVINTEWLYPNELELYGTYTTNHVTTAYTKKSIKLKQMFGINAFEWNFEANYNPQVIDEASMQNVKKFTGVRHYMDWEKLEGDQGSYTYNPTRSGGWNYDTIYARCKMEGIEVLACLKTIPTWMQITYPASEQDAENVPLKYGKDFKEPISYIEQARVAFQYAARYGSNMNVNPALLSVNSTPRWTNDPINVLRIGMGLIKYIECDNERDKWWKGRKAYQTGREYAANLSAFYDGHKNSMGAGVGVKNADPNMKVVIGGFAGPNVDYLKGMIDWCKQYRGYKSDGTVNLCWDIINYHHYSGVSGNQYGNSDRGAAPELTGVDKSAKEMLQVAHEYSYDMPVWISELGYDVNQGSPLKAINIGSKSVLETQADWILRSSLLYAREGIERVFFYQMYDDNVNSSTQFSSMGLGDKPASNYLAQTNKIFGEFSYKETISTNPIVDHYELNDKSAYALMVPDEVGRTMSYTLNLNGADSAYIYRPQLTGNTMSLQRVALANGSLTVTVTETPMFIIPKITNSNSSKTNTESKKILFESITSVNDSAVIMSKLYLYPNPVSNILSIKINDDYIGDIFMQIIDVQNGKLLTRTRFKKDSNNFLKELNLSSLPLGEYLIKIKQAKKEAVKKILKIY